MTAFGLNINNFTLQSAATHIAVMLQGADCLEYVVTPNIDHIVNLESDSEFRIAYENASMIVADGWPVVVAGRFLGAKIPERVAGSDLVPKFLHMANAQQLPVSVFVLGGLGDVPERAACHIASSYPNLKVVGYLSPPLGFERDSGETQKICSAIKNSGANFIIVGLGSPKQEKWLYSVRNLLPPGIAVCAGATVDFLAGSIVRAPRWVSIIGMEWAYRMMQEPKRLAKRYLRAAFLFPAIFIKYLIFDRG